MPRLNGIDAEKLYISPRTVDGHRNNLLEKLGCKNVAGLVVYALQHKLVQIGPDRRGFKILKLLSKKKRGHIPAAPLN